MPQEQRDGMRQLRRLYLGRLGDVLRRRQAIAAQMHTSPAAFDGGRASIREYLKAHTLRPPNHRPPAHSFSVPTRPQSARANSRTESRNDGGQGPVPELPRPQFPHPICASHILYRFPKSPHPICASRIICSFPSSRIPSASALSKLFTMVYRCIWYLKPALGPSAHHSPPVSPARCSPASSSPSAALQIGGAPVSTPSRGALASVSYLHCLLRPAPLSRICNISSVSPICYGSVTSVPAFNNTCGPLFLLDLFVRALCNACKDSSDPGV